MRRSNVANDISMCFIFTCSLGKVAEIASTSAYLRRNIALMEHIQLLATCMVKGMRELPYEERLRRLNIYSLERRLQHIQRSPWLATGGIFWGTIGARPSRTRLQVAVFTYSVGKQHSLWDYPSRGINSRWKKSNLPHLTRSSESWT